MTRKEKIKRILFEHPEIKDKDVAFAVGQSAATFSYQMNDAIKFDDELADNIEKYFKKKGIIKYQQGQCTMVNDLFLEFGSIHSQRYSILSNEIRASIKNDVIDDEEADRLLKKIQDLRDNDNARLDSLVELVKGNVRR